MVDTAYVGKLIIYQFIVAETKNRIYQYPSSPILFHNLLREYQNIPLNAHLGHVDLFFYVS